MTTITCAIDDCKEKHFGRGWCEKHYRRWYRHGDPHRDKRSEGKHGHAKRRSPTYYTWQTMKDRCTNPNARMYYRYGGRGIEVCERWLNSFESFLEDMGERPEGKTIDRIDNDGNYEPGNTRWATRKEQRANQ